MKLKIYHQMTALKPVKKLTFLFFLLSLTLAFAQDTKKLVNAVVDKNGKTLLMQAAGDGNDFLVKKLLDSGADVNARDQDGWTALMYAVRNQNNYNIINILYSSGAALQIRNNHNATPLLLAASYNNNPDILALLLAKRTGNEEEVFNAFIMAVLDTHAPDFIKKEKISLFISKNVPINGFWKGLTPLMYACKYNSSSAVADFLIQNGAKTELKDKNGKTALDYAKANPAFPHDAIYKTLNGD